MSKILKIVKVQNRRLDFEKCLAVLALSYSKYQITTIGAGTG